MTRVFGKAMDELIELRERVRYLEKLIPEIQAKDAEIRQLREMLAQKSALVEKLSSERQDQAAPERS